MFTLSYFLEDNPSAGIAECITNFKRFFDLFPKETHGKFWVAGGALRSFFLSEQPRDMDLYFADDATRKIVIEKINYHLMAIRQGETNYASTWRVHNLPYTIDIIKKNYETPEDTINSFDLSVAKCATDGAALYCDESYFTDLATRCATINTTPDDPLKTLGRIIRYAGMGFTFPQENLSDFLHHVRCTEEVQDEKEEKEENDSSINSSPFFSDPFGFNKLPTYPDTSVVTAPGVPINVSPSQGINKMGTVYYSSTSTASVPSFSAGTNMKLGKSLYDTIRDDDLDNGDGGTIFT